MAANNRFAVAVHILTALAYMKDQPLTSTQIAKSVSANPVVVRRILSLLASAGLIKSKTGKMGGCQLGRPANAIRLYDIYVAIGEEPLFGVHHYPELKKCPVSCQIKKVLFKQFGAAEQAALNKLKKVSLSSIVNEMTNG